jgi:hypothetical protein
MERKIDRLVVWAAPQIRTGKFARGELRCTWAMARQVGVQMISGVGTAKDWDWEFSGGIDGRNVWSSGREGSMNARCGVTEHAGGFGL